MKIPFQAMLAFGFLFFSGGLCSGGESLHLTVSASPSTFTSVGEKITFTYKIWGDEHISFRRGYSVTDDVVDTKPTCSEVGKDTLNCTASHTITAEDLALGYVTSHAVAQAYVGTSNIINFRPVNLTEKATTVVYMENFVPSPTPTITPTITATPIFTPTPLQPGQSIVIPQQNILILQPVLAGSVSACDTGLGFINFPMSEPIPDLTGKNVTVFLNEQQVNCTVAGSRNQVLACSFPASTIFPITVKVNLDDVEVNNFSFNGAICTKTVPTKERDPNDPNTPNAPVVPTPVDCTIDPYNPSC